MCATFAVCDTDLLGVINCLVDGRYIIEISKCGSLYQKYIQNCGLFSVVTGRNAFHTDELLKLS